MQPALLRPAQLSLKQLFSLEAASKAAEQKLCQCLLLFPWTADGCRWFGGRVCRGRFFRVVQRSRPE